MKKLNLTEATVLALEGKLLKEASGKKVLLYPDSEYYDRMEPIDITNEKGILFGWFNDEEIIAYSTGFNTIQEMEKAVKNKEYMIEEFAEDEDFDNMSGEEWWNYIISAIEDSYVDNDSYMSMFLIDTNQNYKILYCGTEEPNIEITEPKSKGNKNKLSVVISDGKGKMIKGVPFLQLDKYEMYPNITDDGHIDISDINNWELYTKRREYQIEELSPSITPEKIKNMITPEIEQEYVKLYQNQYIPEEANLEEQNFIKQCYNSKKFDDDQMFKIRFGLENGLTIEQVKTYADPKFSSDQMDQIKYGLENGLTIEQVKTYADPKFDSYQMMQIRHKLSKER